jgi:hypothetical protein
MQTLKKLAATGLIAAAGTAALLSTTVSFAQAPQQHGFAQGPEFYEWRMAQYHDANSRISPENRSRLTAMQDKLMQMAMDHRSMMIKMEMEIAKAKRDMEMFIFAAAPFQDPRNGGH